MSPDPLTEEQWYAEGLCFSCTQCGNCCSGPPGYVWFDNDELVRMADFMNMSTDEFALRYTRWIRGRRSLNEIKRGRVYDCVFLERDEAGRAGCSIYPVRPTQCKTWPFWTENLESRASWKGAAADCPGMSKGLEGDGKLVPLSQIRIQRDSTPDGR